VNRVGAILFALHNSTDAAELGKLDQVLNPDGPPPGTLGQPMLQAAGPLRSCARVVCRCFVRGVESAAALRC
jgi:hypothetical protein